MAAKKSRLLGIVFPHRGREFPLDGARVSQTFGETFSGQPVSFLISSTETPGWFEVKIIS